MASPAEEDPPLTPLRFQALGEFVDSALMASSDVDQKYLGRFAKATHLGNPFLSSTLYKILGLSVLLAKKLVRARRLRKLDTTRDITSSGSREKAWSSWSSTSCPWWTTT